MTPKNLSEIRDHYRMSKKEFQIAIEPIRAKLFALRGIKEDPKKKNRLRYLTPAQVKCIMDYLGPAD